MEETFFLGLRLNRGVNLKQVEKDSGESMPGAAVLDSFSDAISEGVGSGLLERADDVIRLTPRGRLLSNEVFERFILSPTPVPCGTDTPVRRL